MLLSQVFNLDPRQECVLTEFLISNKGVELGKTYTYTSLPQEHTPLHPKELKELGVMV